MRFTMASQNFMTLAEAKKALHVKVWENIRDTVWNNVVRIEVPTAEGTAFGTGFVFIGPLNRTQVMTNYHVVKDHDGISPIRIGFFYEDDDDGPLHTVEFNKSPTYYSPNGERHGTGQKQDFAVFDVDGIPDYTKGIDLVHSDSSSTPFDETAKTFFAKPGKHLPSKMKIDEGVIVGHPGGGPKRISIVRFQPGEEDDLERRYSREGTARGSSGSPVLVNAIHTILVRGVFALHYKSGKGINIQHVIKTISKQARPSLQKRGKSLQVSEVKKTRQQH